VHTPFYLVLHAFLYFGAKLAFWCFGVCRPAGLLEPPHYERKQARWIRRRAAKLDL